PPESRPQVRVRRILGAVEPERPGDVESLQRPFVQREEREQPLRGERQPDLRPVLSELEPLEQAEVDRWLGERRPRRGVVLRPRAHGLPPPGCRSNELTCGTCPPGSSLLIKLLRSRASVNGISGSPSMLAPDPSPARHRPVTGLEPRANEVEHLVR